MAVPRLVKVASVGSTAFEVAQQADSCFSVSSTGVTNDVGLWISLESAAFALSCLLPFNWFLATFEPFSNSAVICMQAVPCPAVWINTYKF